MAFKTDYRFRPSLSYHLSLRPFLSNFEWPRKTGFTVLVVVELELLEYSSVFFILVDHTSTDIK